jgi:hypothetical protein
MKLKQNAKALDARSEKSTPLKERRYFYATRASSGDTAHPFWLPKVRFWFTFAKAMTLTHVARTDLFLWQSTGSPMYRSGYTEQEQLVLYTNIRRMLHLFSL